MVREQSREAMLQKILGSMAIHMAVVDHEGLVTYASRNWPDFAIPNCATTETISTGVDYRAALERAASSSNPYALAAFHGLRSVLSHRTRHFILECPCHSPAEQRWYVMRIDPMPPRHRGAVISHFDVTDRVRARLCLQASLERYELATLGGRVALWDWEIETGELRVDPALTRLLGFDNPGFGHDIDAWHARIHPEDRAGFTAALQGYLRGETASFELEHRRIDVTGKARWFLTRGSLWRDVAGLPVRMLGLDTDISERKKAENALLRQTRRYQDIFAAAGVAIWEADYSAASQLIRRLASDGVTDLRAYLSEHPDEVSNTLASIRLLDANSQAMRLVGASSNQLPINRMPCALLLDRERHMVEQLLALASGRREYSAEARIKTLNGEIRDVVLSTRFPRPAGLHQSALLCAHDITELVSSQQRYEMAISAGRVSVFDYNITTGIVDLDAALHSMTGLPPAASPFRAEWLGQVHPADRTRLLAQFKAVFAPDAPRDAAGHSPWPPIEFRIKSRSAGTLWVLNRGILMRSLGGAPVRLIGTLTDITSLRAGEIALRRTHRQIRKLTARLIAAQEGERRRIARQLHDDVNQRLASAAITLSSLQQSLSTTPGETRQRVARLQNDIHNLISGIRRISRELHPGILEHAGLEPALRSLCHEYGLAHSLAIRVVIKDLTTPVPVPVALCCYRVVQEALRNVARHAGTQTCTVRIRQMDGMLMLEVRDHGAGFDVQTLRAESPGSGLLSLRGRVRLLGGRIRVASRTGKGVDLRVMIPVPVNRAG